MINEDRIKAKVKKAIALKPTHIILMRLISTSNGMRGGTPKPDKIAELDIFLDDTQHNLLLDSVKDGGAVKRTRGISMLVVVDNIEIKEGDFFELSGVKYKVSYPGMIIKDVYNADLEVIR